MPEVSLLDMHQFVVKERVALMKLSDTYDLLDPETQERVGLATEVVSNFKKFMRLIINKQLMSTMIEVTEVGGRGAVVLRIRRGMAFFRSKVMVEDGDAQNIGYFKSKFLSLGGGFHVYDMQDQKVAEVKGDWKGWNFKFLSSSGKEIGLVTKKWAGLGKELFTSADTYMVSLDEEAADNRIATMLLLAAALAIDTVYKENA